MSKEYQRKLLWILGLGIAAAVGLGLLLSFLVNREVTCPMPEPETQTAVTEPGDAAEPSVPAETTALMEDWRLTLVNPWNPLPQDREIVTKKLPSGVEVDERCFDELAEMLTACKAAGLDPLVCSAFRTREKQESLYKNKVRRVMADGYSEEEALLIAASVVAPPDTSEHQLGLAMDIVDQGHIVLDETQADTKVQKWLMEHSWEYGFILRYPEDKSEITGIIYEPWHYRYVGREAARQMQELGMCLEEYVNPKPSSEQ